MKRATPAAESAAVVGPTEVVHSESWRPALWLTIVAAGVFLAALDQTVVVTVLYKVEQEYQIAPIHFDQLGWVVTAYLLGYTVTLPLLGAVADVYGRRRVYLAAMVVFILGSVLAALSETLDVLIAARVIQAIGGGALLPVSMAMARGWYTPARLAFALGLLGAAAEAGGVLGPLWGVLIVGSFDWRWIFWLNLPLGIILGALALLTPAPERQPRKIDWAGAALLGAALLALTVGLSTSTSTQALAGLGGLDTGAVAETGLAAWRSPLLLGISVLLGIAFVLWERRTAAPLIPLGYFRRLPFSMAMLTNIGIGFALITAMVYIPLLAASVLGGEAIDGGLLLLRMTLLIPVGAIAGGIVAERVQYSAVTVVGLALGAIGLWLMGGWRIDTSELDKTIHLGLTGLGLGLVIAPITSTALRWVRREEAGLSAALVNTSRMVGMMVGLAALSAWGLQYFKSLMTNFPAPLPSLTETAEAYNARVVEYNAIVAQTTLTVYAAGFAVAAIVCALSIIPALFLRRPRPDEEPK